MEQDRKRVISEAFEHAEEVQKGLEREYPGLWSELDRMRASRGQQVDWPDWCLLPMAAAAAVAQTKPQVRMRKPYAIAQMAAMYAWRFSRSVYIFEPSLMSRLLTQVPDAIGVEDLVGLPEWCIYIPVEHPEYPGTGVWAHLEYDSNTGRPELRLLLETGDMPLPIPVYLDRDSTVEALGDYRATTLASVGRTGADVRGGELEKTAAQLAENIDGYLGVLAYLARPEAAIVHAERPGVRPVKPKRAKKDTDVWLVGF